jgi:YHS domain-containing protein
MAIRSAVALAMYDADHWNTCNDCRDGFVMGGADVVHLRGLRDGERMDEADMGVDEHTVEFEGSKFLFRNASNAAQFQTNPQYYMPLYGGF